MLQTHYWKQSGSLHLWRYSDNLRNYAGWHLTADAVGCASLLALLDAFESDQIAGSRTLIVEPPTPAILTVPNNQRSSWTAPDKLRISFSTVSSQWHFSDSMSPVELTFGSDWLPHLRKGLADISQGMGDYSIGPSEDRNHGLWFWWQVALKGRD